MQQNIGDPPNVAGWPGGANWIDSSTLMFRLQIPELIYTASEIRLQPKDDDDQMMGMREMGDADAAGGGQHAAAGKRQRGGGGLSIDATIEWAPYLKRFDGVPGEQLESVISGIVLQTSSPIAAGLLQKVAGGKGREEFIKAATIRLMSTPEYQLC